MKKHKASPPVSSDELARIWDENPGVIRAFIEIRAQYEQLCNEVEYILRKRINDSQIEYSAITSRAKTLKSFAEKISRKHYEEPLKNVTDLAGVRVVYLYKKDRPTIERIIEAEFQVIEKVDKVEEQDSDRFGYGALHYLVNIGRKSSGARYDDLKRMVCEIQVRTVLQDAWAIIDHHLSYKHESDVPKILQRKLNSVAGLFETADDQFDRIKTDRENYIKGVKRKLISGDKPLGQELNLDSFTEFLRWRFPKGKMNPPFDSAVLSNAKENGYSTLSALDQLLKRTEKARAGISAERPPKTSAVEINRAIALEHPDFRTTGWPAHMLHLFKKYGHLLP